MVVYSCVCNLLLSSHPQVILVLTYHFSFLALLIMWAKPMLFSWIKHSLLLLQILPLVPDVINAFAQVVVSPNESDEVKIVVAKAVSHLISVYGQQMQPILSALPPAHANALASFANRRWSAEEHLYSVLWPTGMLCQWFLLTEDHLICQIFIDLPKTGLDIFIGIWKWMQMLENVPAELFASWLCDMFLPFEL